VCLGVTTNREFLAAVLRHPAFADGDGSRVTTAFLEQHFADNAVRGSTAPSWLRALAAASNATLAHAAPPAMWTGWTSSNRIETTSPLLASTGSIESSESWQLVGTPLALTATCASASASHRHSIVGLTRKSRSIVHATIDGRPVIARGVFDGDESWWQCDGYELHVRDLRLAGTRSASTTSAGALRAPMHGRITQSHSKVGATVDAGEVLMVMEAMKMEHQILAPFAGTLAALHARVGDQVAARQILIDIAT
jgi:geranyl-CoA carboxylase alpha subunit